MPKVTVNGKTKHYPYTPSGMKVAHKASMKPGAKETMKMAPKKGKK